MQKIRNGLKPKKEKPKRLSNETRLVVRKSKRLKKNQRADGEKH